MAKRADIWPRWRKLASGKKVLASWYATVEGRPVRLRTKDATVARQRMRDAFVGKWPPKEERAAQVTDEAFSLRATHAEPEPAPEVAPPVSQAAQFTPTGADPGAAAQTAPPSDWTQAAGAAATDASPPITPEVVSQGAEQAAREQENLMVAELLTTMQFWVCGVYAAAKAKHPEFVAPEVPAPVRAIVAGSYKQMLDYGGAAILLPPWVMGLVVPAATAIATGVGCARAWADLAREQKAQRPAPGAA